MRAIFVPADEVRVGPQFGQDDQSILGFLTYSITCVVIKIMVALRGRRPPDPPINCTDFIAKDEWPPNSPDLNLLDHH